MLHRNVDFNRLVYCSGDSLRPLYFWREVAFGEDNKRNQVNAACHDIVCVVKFLVFFFSEYVKDSLRLASFSKTFNLFKYPKII